MTACIEWVGAKSKGGYGQKWNRESKKTLYVHRMEYEKHHGAIPKGLVILHSCDNPSCYNIEHLSLGTHKSNSEDRDQKGRCAKGETSGTSKLTEEQVLFIKQSTLTQVALAKELGVSRSAVAHVKQGTTWRHING